MSVYERFEALNIALPKLTPPVAAFVPFLRSGNLIFLAGRHCGTCGDCGTADSLFLFTCSHSSADSVLTFAVQ